MNQIWIEYINLNTRECTTKTFWFADEAKRFVKYLRRYREFCIVSCGGFEDEDEMWYVMRYVEGY